MTFCRNVHKSVFHLSDVKTENGELICKSDGFRTEATPSGLWTSPLVPKEVNDNELTCRIPKTMAFWLLTVGELVKER